MNYSQRPNFSSGQTSNQSYVRTQLISSGITPARQQQRSIQQNEYSNNSNNISQQSQTRLLNPGLQNTNIQQTSSTL